MQNLSLAGRATVKTRGRRTILHLNVIRAHPSAALGPWPNIEFHFWPFKVKSLGTPDLEARMHISTCSVSETHTCFLHICFIQTMKKNGLREVLTL